MTLSCVCMYMSTCTSTTTVIIFTQAELLAGAAGKTTTTSTTTKAGARRGAHQHQPDQSHVAQINAMVAEYLAMRQQLEEQHKRCVYADTQWFCGLCQGVWTMWVHMWVAIPELKPPTRDHVHRHVEELVRMHDVQLSCARAANVALQEELGSVREELSHVQACLNNNAQEQ